MLPPDQITAEHSAVLPDQARRPEDRITEESPAAVPSEPGPAGRRGDHDR